MIYTKKGKKAKKSKKSMGKNNTTKIGKKYAK